MGSYDAWYVVGEFSCPAANASPIAASVGTAASSGLALSPAEKAAAEQIRARLLQYTIAMLLSEL